MSVFRTSKLLPASLTGPMARHTGLSLGFQLFSVGCGFLFAVAAARLLGALGYGLIAVTLSVVNVAATIALLGANALAVREVGAAAAEADWNRFRAFVRWSASTVVVSSVGVGLIVAMASMAADAYQQVLLLGAFAVPLLAGLLLLRGVNQGARMIVAAQLPMDVLRWGVALALIGYLILAEVKASPTHVLSIVLLSYAASLGFAIVRLWWFTRRLHRSGPPDASRQGWLKPSFSFLAVALLGLAATEMNTLFLGVISGPRDAGLYQPIARLAPLMLLAKDAIDMPLAPRIPLMYKAGHRAELTRLIQRSAAASTGATVVIAAAILLASPLIFSAFGSEFEPVQPYLYWIAAAQIVNAGFGPASILLAMAGDMRRRVQAQAITLAVQAVLTLALVPKFGVAGAVVALSVQMMAWAGIHWWLARRTMGVDTSVLSAFREGAPG